LNDKFFLLQFIKRLATAAWKTKRKKKQRQEVISWNGHLAWQRQRRTLSREGIQRSESNMNMDAGSEEAICNSKAVNTRRSSIWRIPFLLFFGINVLFIPTNVAIPILYECLPV
jgi:hypothetical protein